MADPDVKLNLDAHELLRSIDRVSEAVNGIVERASKVEIYEILDQHKVDTEASGTRIYGMNALARKISNYILKGEK